MYATYWFSLTKKYYNDIIKLVQLDMKYLMLHLEAFICIVYSNLHGFFYNNPVTKLAFYEQ